MINCVMQRLLLKTDDGGEQKNYLLMVLQLFLLGKAVRMPCSRCPGILPLALLSLIIYITVMLCRRRQDSPCPEVLTV